MPHLGNWKNNKNACMQSGYRCTCTCTFLDLSSTACPAVESKVLGDGAEPLSNEWLETMENRPEVLLYLGWTLQSKGHWTVKHTHNNKYVYCTQPV